MPVEVGLQTETGYPHKGKLDYVAPTINQSTGTLAVRGILPNPDRVLLPGYFVRVRVPVDQQQDALLVPDVALGSDQGGRYVLVVNDDNVVEQRKVETGQLDGGLRVIESGLKPDDRVVVAGLLRAIPGQKVEPQLQKIDSRQRSCQIGHGHDLEILHRAAGPGQRHRDPDGPDRRRRAVLACRSRNIPTSCRRPCRSPPAIPAPAPRP